MEAIRLGKRIFQDSRGYIVAFTKETEFNLPWMDLMVVCDFIRQCSLGRILSYICEGNILELHKYTLKNSTKEGICHYPFEGIIPELIKSFQYLDYREIEGN